MNHADPPQPDPTRHGSEEPQSSGNDDVWQQEPGAHVRDILASVGGQLDQIRQVQSELDQQATAIEAGRSQLVEASRELEAERSNLSREREALEQERDRLGVDRDRWAEEHHASRVEREEAAAELQRREDALTALQSEFEEKVRSAEARFSALVDEQEAFDREREQWIAQRHEAEQALDQRETALVRNEGDLAGERDELASVASRLAEERAAHEQKVQSAGEASERLATLEDRCAELETALRDAEERVNRAEGDGLDRAREVEQERDAVREERDAVCGERDAIRGERDAVCEERDAVRGERDAVCEERDAIREERDAICEERDTIRDECSAACEELAAAREECDAARDELAAAQERIGTLEAQLAEASSPSAETTVGSDVRVRAMRQKISKLEAQLAEKHPQLAQTPDSSYQEQLDDLRRKAQRLSDAATHLRCRHYRLRKMRHLLKSKRPRTFRAPDPVRATAAGEKHAATVRRIEQQRLDLVEKTAELAEAERRMHRRWARSRAIVLAGWIVLIGAIAAGGGWIAASQIVPPVRSASINIDARARNRAALSDETTATWRAWHTNLVAEPSFLEALALRLDERKVEKYADSVVLGERLEKDLAIGAVDDDTLILTLAGTDADEITMILDLVASTVVLESGRLIRKRTSDPWATLGGEHPVLNPTAVIDERLPWAGGLFLGLYALILAMTFVIHRRMLSVKREFDADGTLFVDMKPTSDGATQAVAVINH